MQTWIALIRGINVGGHKKMPMASLKKVLESAGCRSVRTYIQSGNVVFSSSSKSKRSLGKSLGDAIETEFGFLPEVLLLTAAEFREACVNNPFVRDVSDPKSLHFFFLAARPESPDMNAIAKLAGPSERYELIDAVFYLFTPDGFGRSKLAATAERKLGQAATARNYSTVQSLLQMIEQAESQPEA